jgi:D-alanine-D-alanine ligase
MRKLRVLVLMDPELIPPDSIEGMSKEEIARIKTEYDVVSCLKSLGHTVRPVGVRYDLEPLENALPEFDPHICFNLTEDFNGVGQRDQHIVSYLELLNHAYTGCNPRGLTLARDKALTKKILAYHGIKVPRFEVFERNRVVRRPDELTFPLLVKSTTEEGSQGIAQASVVNDDAQLVERVQFIHERFGGDAIAEQYIEGRELYVGVLGNRQLQTLPVWELRLDDLPPDAHRIATRRIKMDVAYQDKYGIVSHAARDMTPALERKISEQCKRMYRLLNLSGYARMDLRLTEAGDVYLLEANPNPQICRGEDFADAAAAAGIAYEQLIQKIVTLGLNYQPLGLAAA